MTWRDVLVTGLLFLLPGASMAAAPSAPVALDKTPPMVFYVAKGATDSCGAGCDSWIAVEGRVDGDTADRFRNQGMADVRYRNGHAVAVVAADGTSVEVPFVFNARIAVVGGLLIALGLLGLGGLAWGLTRVNRTRA